MAQKKDEGLNGNEKIEQAVCQLQQEPTQEQLAHTLTVIRRRMRENGQVVVAVEPNPASEQMQLRALRTADGASWWYAFTSFEEEMKSAEAVQSTFLVELEKLLETHGFLIYELLTPDDIQRDVIDRAGAELKAFEHVNYCLAVRKN